MSITHQNKQKKRIHPVLARTRWPRTILYAFSFYLVTSVLPEDRMWANYPIFFFCFIYPSLYYIIAIRFDNTRLAGLLSYSIDSILWASAVIVTNYAIVLLLVGPLLSVATAVLMVGLKRAIIPLVILTSLLLIGVNFVEVQLSQQFSYEHVAIGWLLTVGFLGYVSILINKTTRDFVGARKQLENKNKLIVSQQNQLAAISEVAQLVNSTLDLDQIMKTIMDSLNKDYNFTLMALNFVDEDKQVLYLEKLKGDLPEETIKVLQGINIPLSHSENVFIVSLKSKKPLYLEYADGVETPQDGLDGQLIKLLPAKSLISFPLIIDDKAIGVLTFVDIHKHFHLDEKDIEHMGQYVTYIVSAIRNAKNYKEIQEANIAAINANKAKSQFLANMSHELRTPMNAVIGYSEMLEEDAEDQGLDEMIPDLQKIRKAGTHLLSLINDVLDLSKIEADKVEFYPVRFNASGLLNDIEATAKPLFEKNNNRFEHKQINQLHEGFIDQTRLSQVILNLLSNAAKFTHDGLITLCAERHTISGIDWFTFKVTDNGIGMSEEQLQRIFDPFSQADASTTREYGGTGLGLSISRKLCELMGGTLTVESEVNVGSTFIIKIPAETVMIDNKDQEAYTIIDDSPSTSDSRHTILVIDDDENIRDIMNRVLTKEGYQVYTAASGEVGIEMALLYKPNVITLDVLMPGQDGWSVLNILKSDSKLKDIPVVMQTILDESRRGFLMGASDFLTKPIERNRLIEVIKRLDHIDDLTALVVEDDANISELFVNWLEKEGWEVETAINGHEALQSFEKTPANLIILDLMMPKMDGFEFLEALNNQQLENHPSVIVVTAKDLSPEDHQRLNRGVEVIVEKGGQTADNILKEIRQHLDTNTKRNS